MPPGYEWNPTPKGDDTMSRGTVLLRVDGSAEEGMGRIARCLALANALQRRRYQMTFISRLEGVGWPDRIRRFRHVVAKTPHEAGSNDDREQLLAEITQRRPVMMITDSSGLDEEYLALLANRVPLLISLDEAAQTRFPSDLVLNPSLGAAEGDFRLYPGTQLVAGERYAMVRSEFRRARNVRATEPSGQRRILLALGGGDVVANTMAFAKALLESSVTDKVDAVLGIEQQGSELLRELKEQYPDRLFIASDTRDLGIRMTKSHLLVTGGGNTALEAACVGMPMVLVTRHEHHKLNAERLEEAGVAHYLGHHDRVKPQRLIQAIGEILDDRFERKAMSRSGRMLVDGRGPDRMVTATEVLLCRSRRSKALAA